MQINTKKRTKGTIINKVGKSKNDNINANGKMASGWPNCKAMAIQTRK
jgi:hypothetical protein